MRALTALWLFIAIVTATSAEEAIWPQWRGPNRNGKVEGPKWPASFQKLEKRWNRDLEPSYSGPIVAKDRVFVTETKEKKMEVVRALDRKTGKELWKAEWKGAMSVPFFARSNGSWIRATPAYDGESLYVAGMRDLLVCLDASNGKERWRVDFTKRFKSPLPAFGFVCSPLIDKNAIYVQAGASFVKLDKETGKTVWRSLNDGGGMYGSAFSSPVKETIGGKEQMVVQTRSSLDGVDPNNGKVLWSTKVPAFRGMNILTPTVYNNQIFTSSYGGRGHLFEVSKKGDEQEVKTKWKTARKATCPHRW